MKNGNQHYEFHPYAAVLPMMGQVETNELAADIQMNGLRSEIVLLDGLILDGRNRYMACGIAGTEPRFRDFNGDGDPIDFIISVNLRRRHMSASQKAMVVAKIADLPRGNPDLNHQKPQQTPNGHKVSICKPYTPSAGKSNAAVAAEVDVSATTVKQAKQVLREAPKKDVEAVERGEKSVATVVKEIKKAKESKAVHLDKTGYPVPETILQEWNRAAAFDSTLREISKIKSIIEAATEDKDPIFGEVGNAVIAHLKNAYSDLTCVIPYAVCTTCQGRIPDKCGLCLGRGFISKFRYSLVAIETRRMRERMA